MFAAQPIHGPNPAFVTKELDLEEMEHANFDPEVAAAYHEDGLEEADLGYWAGGDYGMGHDPPEGARGQSPADRCHCEASTSCSMQHIRPHSSGVCSAEARQCFDNRKLCRCPGEVHDDSHVIHAGEFKADEHFQEAANAQHHEGDLTVL